MGPRGPKKHLKRLAAPKSWMLDKLGGAFTIKPSSGPHKQGESLPIALFLRNRLKYALNVKEVESILKQRLIKIDGKTRTDPKFPTGFMDVVQCEKTGENFRIIYDVKGRFTVHRITATESKYKLCRVREVKTGPKGVPYLYTSDGDWRQEPRQGGPHHVQGEARWFLRHCAREGRQWPHFRHSPWLHLHHRQGQQALHLSAQGQGCQAHHRRGEGQEAWSQVDLMLRLLNGCQ